MKHSVRDPKISAIELAFFFLGALLLLLFAAIVANGQTKASGTRTVKAHTVIAQQPLYQEYRGVRLGMTATEVRAKFGEPAFKSDDQDLYVFSPSETTQFAYNAERKLVTISTDYTGGVGAPDYRAVVGEGLLERPDGSVFRMVMHTSAGFWVSYNKSATVVPVVTITISTIR